MPLPDEALEEMRKAIELGERTIAEQEENIEEAKRAGINVSKEIEALNRLKEAVRLRKEVYGKYFK